MSFVGFRAERPELHEQCVQDESLFAQRIRVSPILETWLMLMSVLNTVLRRWDRKEH